MYPNLEFEKLHVQHFEDEEESLSFSDLPITKFTVSKVDHDQEEKNETDGDEHEPEFDFGSLIRSGENGMIKHEMCSADEVFSGGQILPFRHSVSSSDATTRTTTNWMRSVSRSESCSRSSSIRSSSTRSSSIRSQFSSTSASTTTTTTSSNNNSISSVKTEPTPEPKTRVRNTFHSHPSLSPSPSPSPSPKPQVLSPSSGPRGSGASNPRKSTMWEVLRLGLVRTPEIELQDLKQRHRFSTSSKTTPFILPRSNSNMSDGKNDSNGKNKMTDLLLKKKKKSNNDGGGFFKSCKCSVLAIEPIPSTRELLYEYEEGKYGKKGKNSTKYYYHLLKEDKEMAENRGIVVEAEEEEEEGEEKKKKMRQGKKVMSRQHHQHHHRTFEWLRDLSHASVLNA